MTTADDPLGDLPDDVFEHSIDDYYDLLGLTETSAQSEVQQAYRKKISKYHPDQSDHPNAEAITFALNQSKEVLLDQNNRVRYNELGHEEYYRQELTKTGTQSQTKTQDDYESTFKDMLKLAKLDDYKKEPWWKTIIKSKGFKIIIFTMAFLVGLFIILQFV